jgi:hypothetical protein
MTISIVEQNYIGFLSVKISLYLQFLKKVKMKRTALFYLIGVCFLSGCVHNNAAVIRKHEMSVGYVHGPFFHYGQTELSETRHINLGNIPRDVSKIRATVPFSNHGHDRLIIEKVEGLCPYFAGWELVIIEKVEGHFVRRIANTEILPYNRGEINVFFDKSKIEPGPATCFVRIKTNDISNSDVKIAFDFNVIGSLKK